MTELELLEDTVKYYSEDIRRRCKRTNCTYSPITVGKEGISEGCAIGRHLDKDFALEIDNLDLSCSGIMAVLEETDKSRFPEWMLKMKPNFLEHLQDLHDRDFYWNEKGLSEEGINCVNMIKNNLVNNSY